LRFLRAIPVLLFAAPVFAVQPLTVVEATGYARTSLYPEVVDFLYRVEGSSSVVAITPLATSIEGRMIPLVILSRERVRTPAELRATGKPAVLVMANIHAGEVEGKEACQMLIRDVASGTLAGLLDHQVILVVPIFNADGNDKLGKNRHDDGPELAGVRYNGQGLDLNRDYTKLESPEVRGLVRLLDAWDPVLLVDMHTTDGSYHREPVSYTTCANANGPQALADYMWSTLFPAVATALKSEYGYDSVPYGEFVNGAEPAKGWINEAIEARYGTNYVGLRNRLAILDENYSYADFKTRVLASYAYIRAVLEFTSDNAAEIASLVRRLDRETAATYFKERFVTETTLERLRDVTVEGWEFTTEPVPAEEKAKHPWLGDVRVKPTGVPRDYTVPYLALAAPKATVSLPLGYVVLPGHDQVVEHLQAQGIIVEKLVEACRLPAERFVIEKIQLATTIYQGHVQDTLTGHYEKGDVEVPAGSTFVDMRQPLARLIPVLLEPTSTDSLASWGFFNRVIVRQWSNEPAPYPVLRVAAPPPAAMLVGGAE
jgi:Zinc carboxypeptidase